MERAKLDVSFDNAQGRRVHIDVAITDAATVDVDELRRRSEKDGRAATSKEDQKRVRYPGPELLPFVLEALGKPGASANAFLKALAPQALDERAKVLGAARQSLSALLQSGNAELMLSALG